MKTAMMFPVLLALAGLGDSTGPGAQTEAADQPVEAVERYRSGLAGSKHDFSESGLGNSCSGCHVPHIQAVKPTTTEGGQTILKLYRVEGQRQVLVPGRYTPGPTSMICLSCHDGTLASSTIGSGHAMLAGVREGFPLPSGFVWRDHPIGIAYPRDDPKYRPIAVVTKGKNVPLPEGRVECVSCHDPHNSKGVEGMLVMSNRRSQLCLACHIK